MIPKELNDVFETYDEDDCNLYITKAALSGSSFLLEFALEAQGYDTDKSPFTSTWTIEATRHIKNNISFNFASSIEISNDHPLLWEFADTQCQLYFTGVCEDPPKLFYDLYHLHRKLFDKHQCFNISFGEETGNYKAFQYTNGLLTTGPKKLMQLYAGCLLQNNLNYTIIGESPGRYWDGQQYILNDPDLKILLLGGTYIIAKDFSFAQLK